VFLDISGVMVSRPYLHDRRAVICNRLLAILVDHQQVAAIGAQRRLDGGLDGQTGIDVGDDLAFALRGVGA
jgi:hypothetical protein